MDLQISKKVTADQFIQKTEYFHSFFIQGIGL